MNDDLLTPLQRERLSRRRYDEYLSAHEAYSEHLGISPAPWTYEEWKVELDRFEMLADYQNDYGDYADEFVQQDLAMGQIEADITRVGGI